MPIYACLKECRNIGFWLCARLSLPLADAEGKVGCVSAIKMKIFDVLFCIALDFHYLCGQFTNICIVCYD